MNRGVLGRRIVLTQGRMVHIAGSEIVTLELAEYFTAQGDTVAVCAREFGHPVLAWLEGLGVRMFHPHQGLPLPEPDLMWIHHQVLPNEVLNAARSGNWETPTIFNHMSSFGVPEFPFLPRIEASLSRVSLYNSPESMDSIRARFWSGELRPARESLFANPAPEAFHVPCVSAGRSVLQNVLVVSNHPPIEVTEAVDSLSALGLAVQFIGRHHTSTRVTADDVAWADAIISIGKTVQYGMAMGVPVYVYDHFGGPGYLTRANVSLTGYHNFSGRGFARKSAATIAKEVRFEWSEARRFASQLRSMARDRYFLPDEVERVVELALRTSPATSWADRADWEAALSVERLLRRPRRPAKSTTSAKPAKPKGGPGRRVLKGLTPPFLWDSARSASNKLRTI